MADLRSSQLSLESMLRAALPVVRWKATNMRTP